ncbi:hypothetical protein WJX84_000215 [Apatococcus fuscideae]|uniref:Uncharacterized protein n=1 Tax=Apatococcus fuscideae TaxID=2026836 RepID=A0AAW1SZK2_9CHLO
MGGEPNLASRRQSPSLSGRTKLRQTSLTAEVPNAGSSQSRTLAFCGTLVCPSYLRREGVHPSNHKFAFGHLSLQLPKAKLCDPTEVHRCANACYGRPIAKLLLQTSRACPSYVS